MNIYALIRNKIIALVEQFVAQNKLDGVNYQSITVEIPNDPAHGEISTNIAMILAKPAKNSPKAIASIIAEQLKQDQIFKEVTIAGNGFINMVLQPQCWQQELLAILKEHENYGKSNIGNGQKVNIEFVSSNPTGPVHIGHARSAVYGSALASLLEYVGFKVTREFYVNDFGNQFRLFVKSIHIRYLELCGRYKDTFPEACYPGEYVIDMAKALKLEHGEGLLDIENEQTYSTIRKFAIRMTMDSAKTSLKSLGVTHDVYTYESTLHHNNKIEPAINLLMEQGLVYRGILPRPKDESISDWEEREQLLVRTTNYRDSMDRALQKSDGEWTYFAADIAYLQDKLSRDFDRLILLLGHDHIGYQKRLEAVCMALNDGKNILEIKICQLVTLLQDGKPFKMSKRSGNFVTVEQVLEMVSKDIVRFIMLTRKNDVSLEFDVTKVKEQSKDNPVFYVQYASARAHSVLENAGLSYSLDTANLALLQDENELALIRLLSYWPRQAELAALHYEPHRIAFYLQNVAAQFHAFWHKGNENKELRFIVQDDADLTACRLALVKAVINIISNGLKLIGVTPMGRM